MRDIPSHKSSLLVAVAALWVQDATSMDPRIRAQAWQDFERAGAAPESVPFLVLSAMMLGKEPGEILTRLRQTAQLALENKTARLNQKRAATRSEGRGNKVA
jgi:hypothetical protein